VSLIHLCRDSSFAPCCYIIARERADGTHDARDESNTILVQAEWDYPSVARNFGWHGMPDGFECEDDHLGTDGTIDCPSCNAKALDFISAASCWIADNVGAVADDPGYF
jgi:hypothetical protein